MYQTILKAKKVLDELKIPFWLDCGTLLFMHRNHTPDITDTDLGVMAEDIQTVADNLDKFYKEGFELHRVWTHPAKGVTEVSIKIPDEVKPNCKIDIFANFTKGDYKYFIPTVSEDNYIFVKRPNKHFETFTKLSIDNDENEFNIPFDVEGYLSYYYGSDWRTPKPAWDWTKDAPCIDKEFQI